MQNALHHNHPIFVRIFNVFNRFWFFENLKLCKEPLHTFTWIHRKPMPHWSFWKKLSGKLSAKTELNKNNLKFYIITKLVKLKKIHKNRKIFVNLQKKKMGKIGNLWWFSQLLYKRITNFRLLPIFFFCKFTNIFRFF